MKNQASGIGIVVTCDFYGAITGIVRDEQGIIDVDNAINRPLASIFDRGSLIKALNFISEIKTRGVAYDWQLSVPVNGAPTILNFAGIFWNDMLFIVGAKTSYKLEILIDELMRIGNEQANKLRMALKENIFRAKEQMMLETERYDELGKLNNELANLQREISKKNVELEKLNEEKNRFLGMAAHDLRNPLHTIQMYSEFLLAETTEILGEEHHSFLGIIHSSSQFMLRLVNNLLDVAKIESGKLVLEIAPTDLVELVKKCGETNNVLASRKNISVTFEFCDSIPALMLDSSKIEQALNNLISNAVKFSEFGSCVIVRLSSTPEEVTISVIDEGPGVPEHELGKLFQPFQRTSVKSTAGEESTGLGLAIVKKIVLGHHGRVWVESQPGKGSAFFMALPIP